jgi:XTP/dITP diphosphohydrolase
VKEKLVLATHNPGKLAEFAAFFPEMEFVSAGALGLPAPDETAPDFPGNARLKAVAAAVASGARVIADDSGICVAAMSGGPGVASARYAGTDYPAAFRRILATCDAAADFRAWFICALCIAAPDGATSTFIGRVDGQIVQPRGNAGFGYDPIFVPEGATQTFAELGPAKESISHRAHAVAQAKAWLTSIV